MKTIRSLIFGTLLVCCLSPMAQASEPTALVLIKEANRYVGEDVKDQIVQIRSEKSIASLQPIIWYVVYYDKDATFKTTEVKIGAGKKLETKRPMRQPFAFAGSSYKNILEQKTLKVDSDKAIKIATAEPLLEKLNIRATQLWLERRDTTPVWKVRLWAAKLRDNTKDADIGDVYINAAEGTVIESDLHINRVD